MTDPVYVAIIDDDPEHIDLLRRSLTTPGNAGGALGVDLAVEGYETPEAALAGTPGDGITAFLCDYLMPGGTALDWMPHLLGAGVGPVMVMTSQGSEEIASKALEMGASRYMRKEVVFRDGESLRRAVHESIREYRIERRNRELMLKLKRANKELEVRAAKLDAMTQSAHAFVADVAHDFRTPLATIKEFSSIIRDGIAGPVCDQQTEFLRHIDAAVLDLTHMVDDFLDSARLRAGLLPVDRRAVAPGELLESIRVRTTTRAAARDITIEERVAPGTPDLWVDRDKCGRVLTNLIVNAVKFSESGSTVRVEIGPDERGSVRIAVVDEGRGISEDDLKTIFDRFQQVDTMQTSKIRGFGLGLSISSQLALLNYAHLSVESAYGRGSTFSFAVSPSDPEGLLNHYARFAGVAAQGVRVHVLRVTRPGGAGASAELTEIVRAISYPLDLVVDAGEAGVLAIGFSDNPDLWRERLVRAYAGKTDGGQIRTSRLHVWLLPEQSAQFCASVTSSDSVLCERPDAA